MSNARASAATAVADTADPIALRHLPVAQTAANEPLAAPAPTPRHSREPLETDGPATCLVWF